MPLQQPSLDRWPKPRRNLILGGLCIDHFFTTMSIQLGAKNRVSTKLQSLGGGAANIAINLKTLNANNEVLLVSPVGADREHETAVQLLAKHDVGFLWGSVPQQPTSRSWIVTTTEDRCSTIFSETGARAAPLPLELVEKLLPGCDVCWLVAPTHNEQIRPILQMTSRENVPVFFGLGTAQVDELDYHRLAKLVAGPIAMLICNRREAMQLTGKSVINKQLEALHFEGRVRTVEITDGPNGIDYSPGVGGIHGHEPAYADPRRPVVDETGAGDAAQAVIGHWLLRGEPLREAVRAGARQGFEAVTALGATAQLLSESALHAYLRDTNRADAA